MSDYLSNLAARTLGLTGGVRPRLPSRFEPPTAHAGALEVYSKDTEGGATEQSPDSPPQNFFAQDRADSAAQNDATRHSEGPSFLSPRRHDEQQAGRSSARADHKNPHQKSAFLDSIKDSSTEDASHTPAARIEKSVRINLASPTKSDATKRDDGSETPLRRRDGQKLENRVARLEAEKSRHDAGAKHTRPSPSAESFAPAPPFTPAPPVAPRSIRPRVVAPPQSSERQAEAGNSAPHIKVTIGRVEVRAVMPVAPPARPTRAAPASPSLDDYLKKGERGAR